MKSFELPKYFCMPTTESNIYYILWSNKTNIKLYMWKKIAQGSSVTTNICIYFLTHYSPQAVTYKQASGERDTI